jgi:RNA-binding protein YhbY
LKFPTGKIASNEEALNRHELIKVKFIEIKEKKQKKALAGAIEDKRDSQLAGIIGHTAIFFREHRDPDKRKISLPAKKTLRLFVDIFIRAGFDRVNHQSVPGVNMLFIP